MPVVVSSAQVMRALMHGGLPHADYARGGPRSEEPAMAAGRARRTERVRRRLPGRGTSAALGRGRSS
ncbi:Conserved protein of unknown function [Mycobacterium canettii CIPT 140070010]|nr:Conserved protein of unknown function [Mycobacterium canettii CIPT 140070010]